MPIIQIRKTKPQARPSVRIAVRRVSVADAVLEEEVENTGVLPLSTGVARGFSHEDFKQARLESLIEKVANPPDRRPLMAHQVQGLRYCIERDHPALFMEMRLGKTLLSIRYVKYLDLIAESPLHCLVVAPITVMESWERELALEGEQYVPCYGLGSRAKRVDAVLDVCNATPETGRKWLLINYESLRCTPGIAYAPWDVAALDESRAISSPKSQISRLCCDGFRDTKHRMILTGLPNPEGEMDIFQQFLFLHGVFADCYNFWDYRAKYFVVDQFSKWSVHPHAIGPLKQLMHDKAFVLSRKDAGIGSKKIYEQRVVRMNAEQGRLYNQIEDEFAAEWKDKGGNTQILETQWAIVKQTWLARVAGGFTPDGVTLISDTKIKETVKEVSDEVQAKSVIWFRFRAELLAVGVAFRKAGYEVLEIHGDVLKDDRKLRLQRFREARGCRVVLLATIKTAMFGIDCSQACDTAIYYSNEYSCNARSQSEDRIGHPSKREPLLYLDMISQGTIDDDAVKALTDKKIHARMFLTLFEKFFQERLANKKHRRKHV